nr:hypothetical protein [Candidatus Sigynarchaeota archaeon]
MANEFIDWCVPCPAGMPWKTKQVSTHAHDRMVKSNPLLRSWKEMEKAGCMHGDNVRIKPASSFQFPSIVGPGIIVNIWLTFMPYNIASTGSGRCRTRQPRLETRHTSAYGPRVVVPRIRLPGAFALERADRVDTRDNQKRHRDRQGGRQTLRRQARRRAPAG